MVISVIGFVVPKQYGIEGALVLTRLPESSRKAIRSIEAF